MAYYPTANDIASKTDIFKPVGLVARGNDELAQILNRLGIANFGPAADRQVFNAGLEPQYQHTLTQLLHRLLNTDYAVEGQRAANIVNAVGGQAARQAGLHAQASGQGGGSAVGAMTGALSNIGRQAAGAQLAATDPSRRTNDLISALQQLLGAQQTNPYMQNVLQLHPGYAQWSAQNQASQAQKGMNSWLPQVMGIAGQYAGQGGFGRSPQPAQTSNAYGQPVYGTQPGVRPGNWVTR